MCARWAYAICSKSSPKWEKSTSSSPFITNRTGKLNSSSKIQTATCWCLGKRTERHLLQHPRRNFSIAVVGCRSNTQNTTQQLVDVNAFKGGNGDAGFECGPSREKQ